MKSSWGNVKIVTTKYDRLIYACPRKTYTRSHPYPETINRFAPLKNEKAAIIMLRRIGYPINMLSKALGRSTSYIHRTLRAAIMRLSLRPCDMRKLPGNTRIYLSGFRWRNLQKWIQIWEPFLLGETDRPP